MRILSFAKRLDLQRLDSQLAEPGSKSGHSAADDAQRSTTAHNSTKLRLHLGLRRRLLRSIEASLMLNYTVDSCTKADTSIPDLLRELTACEWFRSVAHFDECARAT